MAVGSSANEVAAKFISNGGVELYYDNSKKFQTYSNGIQNLQDVWFDSDTTAGRDAFWDSSASLLRFYDSAKATFGNDDDLQIYHTGSENHIKGVANHTLIFSTNNSERWGIEGGGHLKPHANNSYDIGTSSYRVRNIYTNDLHLSNEGSSNDVDGTWGDWTIQEGESDLFLKNNRSGKKYKFNLTEVS